MDPDGVLRALFGGQARSRRIVCRYVAATGDEPVTLEELSTCVGTDGDVTGGESASAVDYWSVALRLHHVDLPALDDADVVDYHPDRRTVRAGPHLEAASAFLGAVDTDPSRPTDLEPPSPSDGGN